MEGRRKLPSREDPDGQRPLGGFRFWRWNMEQLENLNVVAQELLITPAQLKAELPVSDQVRHKVHEAREQVRNILSGTDHRLLIVVGPCSIHDVVAAEDYAQRLKALADELAP